MMSYTNSPIRDAVEDWIKGEFSAFHFTGATDDNFDDVVLEVAQDFADEIEDDLEPMVIDWLVPQVGRVDKGLAKAFEDKLDEEGDGDE